jgi:ATP-dependent Clp protease ATP-binding subunit ClpA
MVSKILGLQIDTERPRKMAKVLGSKPGASDSATKTSEVLGVEWKKLVVGQDEAIDTMVPTINRFLAGMSIPDKPVGNFFLCGPTGMGKTKTAEALAKVIHHDEKKLIRINCGEYQMEHEIAKLIGSPPGYLGHRESAPEFNQARLKSITTADCSMAIILWDEIEKAHQSVFRILLGMIDDGKLRIGSGDVVNLENCLMLYTSNIGSRELSALLTPTYGFDSNKAAPSEKSIKSVMDHAFKKFASPEFINRMDELIVFKPLTEENITDITKLEVTNLQNVIIAQLGDSAFTMYFSARVLKFLSDKGHDPKYGARSLKRTINKLVYNMVTNAYLDGEIEGGDIVSLHMRGDEVIFKTSKKEPIEEAA